MIKLSEPYRTLIQESGYFELIGHNDLARYGYIKGLIDGHLYLSHGLCGIGQNYHILSRYRDKLLVRINRSNYHD